ncbi:zinc finger protein Rlf-like [Aplochiton taeniatus]
MTFQKNPPSEEEEEKEEDEVNVGEYDADEVECIKKLEHQSDVKSSEKGRDTMHLVSKSNLCYILTQYRKPFHCLVEDCVAAFTDQDGLVRHLKTVHNYSRSQLALENDLDFTARPPPTLLSDEPLSQYRCGFASCDASFLLKSSLVRHTLENHCQPSDQVRCMYEGCTRVFDQLFKLRKHILHSHSRYYDSYVLRLQSTHKKSISGCQKKLIVTLPSGQTDSEEETTKQSLRLSPKSEGGAWSEEMVKEEERDLPPRNGNIKPVIETCDDFIYRSHEEALQMCQDRCLRDAYPCMVQNCDSVVKFDSSLRRHYLKVHRMTLPYYVSNEDKLLFTAEQLEELIQRKSAQLNSTVAHAPNGVLKMEYQAEPEKPGGPSVPMSLHSIKTEPCDEDNHNSLGFTEEAPPVKTNVLVGADDLLYGEPNTGGQTHEPLATQNNLVQEEKHRWQSTNPPVIPPIVDLSPPSSLRFTIDDCFVDMSSSKDGGRMPNTPAQQPTAPVRQPLKRKNELSAHQSNLKDSHPHSHPSLSFDIATYKPMGFESSFLKFIQETTPTKEQDTLRCRDSYKRSCSVKENNQMGITLTRSKRTKTAPQKPLPITGDSISAQNLQSILDKSLTGCGDMAIKQLQHLRPVVVLERPTASTFVSDHFPKITNDGKLIFGS